MKKSRNVRRAWAGSEKDVRLQKQHLSPPLPPRFSPSPPSFRASADVSPVGMSPVGQSQFIPLGEILCLAVSAMNAAHKPVSQEALVEHLAAGFPGVPTPSPEAVRHALNALVRERKIYPTAEGYFLVTPQTYFITPSLIRSNNKWYHLDDRLQEQQASSPRPPPCASPKPGERPARKSREDPRCPRREEPRREEPRGETPKERRKPEPPDGGEPPPPPRPRPATSPPEPADKGKGAAPFPYKTDTLTKKKEANGEKQAKRFGLRLFRLSFKKERTRQLATFSGQFPPEEWPLRDEDAPGGNAAAAPVPREIEMEIIRRINPDLTVENVARHTAVMKRLEEERAQRRRAGSSAPPRGGRGRRGHRRVPHGKSRSHSKPRTSRGEPSEGSDWDLLFMERDFRFFSHSLVRSPREAAAFTLERRRSGGGGVGAAYLVHSNPNIAEAAYCPVAPEWDVSGELAKRRTEMPFPEPSRGTCQSRVQRSHSHNQDRKSRHERSDRAKERSRSMDNSLQGPGPDSEAGPEERAHYYTDDGTLRATRRSGHFSRMVFSAAKFHADFVAPADPAAPPAKGGADESRAKGRDGLPTYGELMGLCAPSPADDYFQCNTSNETVLTAPSPQAKSEFDTPTSTVGRPRKGGSPAERQTPRLASPRKEDAGQGGAGGGGSARQTPEPPPGARLTPHQHNADTGGGGGGGGGGSIKRKEIFSKDTLFKPPLYGDAGYGKSGTMRKAPHAKSAEAPDNPEPQPPSGPAASPALRPQSAVPAASFDYYNVSDDEEAEGDSRKDSAEADQAKELREAGGKSGGGTGVGGGGGAGGEGTIKWLLEREKEHDLQRKLESNLTLLSPKETENGGSQKSAHSARLDSMDSSSVTVDSGFNSPRTRESLASNTSSIVESNRRQNPALSPGHHVGGAGLPFAFRAAAEAPAPSQADKLQKPANCLASITSV